MPFRAGKHLIANCYETIPSWWERCMRLWVILEKRLRFPEAGYNQLGIVLPFLWLRIAFLEWHFGSSGFFHRHLWDLEDIAGSGEPFQVMVNFGSKSLSFCNDSTSCFWRRSSKKTRQLGFCGMKTKSYPYWGILEGHFWRRSRSVVVAAAAIQPIR